MAIMNSRNSNLDLREQHYGQTKARNLALNWRKIVWDGLSPNITLATKWVLVVDTKVLF